MGVKQPKVSDYSQSRRWHMLCSINSCRFLAYNPPEWGGAGAISAALLLTVLVGLGVARILRPGPPFFFGARTSVRSELRRLHALRKVQSFLHLCECYRKAALNE